MAYKTSPLLTEQPVVDLLSEISSLFASSLNLKENIDFMLRAAHQLVEFDAATVYLLDERGQELSAMATYPHSDQLPTVARFAVGEGIVGWAVRQAKLVNIPDATSDQRFKTLDRGHPPRSMLVVPLATPQRMVGAISLGRRKVSPFTGLEAALARVLTNQAAIAIENARLYHSLRRQLEQIEAQRKELVEANAQIREVSRLKSEFLANMSHELRTPLNAIMGFSELLKDNLAGPLSDQQRHDCLQTIHTSGQHLLALINDVLDLSKIEAGRMDLLSETFVVAPALREVLNVIRPLAMKKEIDITIGVQPEDLTVHADKSKVKQVMYNLLSNAIKFTPHGGRVMVSARIEGDALRVAIADTGIGIPPEHQGHIFTAFYQVQGGNNREYPGTGLGLALSKRLVDLHGGTIGFESKPGRGTTFFFTLPMAPGVQPAPRRKILIIEDNASSLDLTQMVLQASGYLVDSAGDSQEGWEKACDSHPDLILMDVQLPGIDGLSLTRKLRADPRTAHIKVVALTANAMKGTEEQALEAGCAGYITKPIEIRRFITQVTGYFSN